ncbi:MAG: 16S rRNA (cytosine(1402)-N(4))-methyltransferase [SAR202 cluster bacterium Casp-Chloro-G4]|nr:16S rRNA (cytosine(1402)-N(4))-methyltransferase RsmH [Chloroflexota bacterium]PKB61917.1 MAG: 16S rRNA (cytosine(1402)-N(4))-methyltransferase [SAR202 cluster bacterium Casp-Chloro-G4]
MDVHHTPVMVEEVLTALQVKSDGLYIDCTTGEGGHALSILKAVSPPPRLIGFDLDADALKAASSRLKEFEQYVELVQGNYADMTSVVNALGIDHVDGVLMDLGISSLQLNEGHRGFSFQQEAPLDMRFDEGQTVTAADVVNEYSEQDLANAIYKYGEERGSRRIARGIVYARPLGTTTQLADVVARSVGRPRGRIHPATKTFQAIRMVVNGELENVEAGLEQGIQLLEQGGRLAIISYHSLEDRLVKTTFRTESRDCICPPETPKCVCGHTASIRLVNRRVIKPKDEEVAANPRSRSARLRVVERT